MSELHCEVATHISVNIYGFFNPVNLEIEECGHDAGHVKGKVILWVDTGDILFFII